MSVIEKFEYVCKQYEGKGIMGDWYILGKLMDEIQELFTIDLQVADWGIKDFDDDRATIYNPDHEPIIQVYYYGYGSEVAPEVIQGTIRKIEVVAENVEKITFPMPCPLCKEGEMEYEPLKNPKAMSTFRDEPVTHVYVCDTCPAVLMEWYDTPDTHAITERLK